MAFSGCLVSVIAIMLGWCRTSHLMGGGAWRISWQVHQVEWSAPRRGIFQSHALHMASQRTCVRSCVREPVSQITFFLSGKTQSWTNVSWASSVANFASENATVPSDLVSWSLQYLELPPFYSWNTRFLIPHNPVWLFTAHSCSDKSAEDLIPDSA